MKVNFFHSSGFKWSHKNTIYAKGYIYDSRGRYYKEEELVSLISEFDFKELIEFIKEGNGSFAIVWQKGNEIVISVDRIRSFPLFYCIAEKEIIVSDDAYYLAEYQNLKSFDEVAYKFIQFGGFAPENKTLFSSVFQLMGGQILHIQDESSPLFSAPCFYYRHIHDRNKKISQKDLVERFSEVLNNTFNRLIQSTKDRTIVIPLSGGSDSRLIVGMLKKLNFENVICYTYGRPDSYETKIAGKVARTLNYPWHFINYNSNVFEDYFDKQSESFRKYTGNYSCSPQEQEYFAVRELISNKLIPENSVFVPGYSGDLPAGSYFPGKEQLAAISKGNGLEVIIEKHFKKHRNKSGFATVEAELSKIFNNSNRSSQDEFISDHENWFTLNKVSKYVVNGVRTFEFFGYEWRMPLWDNEFIEFFYSIPNEERIDKKFYKDCLSNFLFKPYNIDFVAQTFDSHFTHHSFLNTLKYYVPGFMKVPAKSLLIKKQDRDVNALSELFEMVNRRIYDGKFEDKEKNINYILANWYLKEAEIFKER